MYSLEMMFVYPLDFLKAYLEANRISYLLLREMIVAQEGL